MWLYELALHDLLSFVLELYGDVRKLYFLVILDSSSIALWLFLSRVSSGYKSSSGN